MARLNRLSDIQLGQSYRQFFRLSGGGGKKSYPVWENGKKSWFFVLFNLWDKWNKKMGGRGFGITCGASGHDEGLGTRGLL